MICVRNLTRQLVHAHNAIFMLFEVRCLNNNIISCDISSGDIVDHLLTILSIGIVDILLHSGGKC